MKSARLPKSPRRSKSAKRPIEILTREEVDRMLGASNNKCPTGIRNTAILIIMYRAGLRCGEMIDLALKDLDLGRLMIRVLHGKGDKSRVIGIDPKTAEYIQKWMDVREQLFPRHDQHQNVFCTMKGDWICPCYIRVMVKRLAKRAGIDKRVHPHAFRHTHASELADEDVPISVISQQLGHSRPNVTGSYIHVVNPKQRLEQMKSREW